MSIQEQFGRAQVLSGREVAEALGVSPEAVRKLVERGHLVSTTIGRKRLFPVEALQSVIDGARCVDGQLVARVRPAPPGR